MTSITTQPWRRWFPAGGAALFLLAATNAHAAFELVADYEDGLGETTVLQHENPLLAKGSHEVLADPLPGGDANNNVLMLRAGETPNNNIRAITPIPTIANGETGTVFFRFAVDSSSATTDGTFGVSPVAAPTGFGDLDVLLNPNANGEITARNVDAYEPVVDNRTNRVWYKAWLVINNEADTTDIYLQGGKLAEPTLVGDAFGFRTTAAGDDLVNMVVMLAAGGEEPAHNGIYYFDDLHVDIEGENLVDPVPLAAPSPAFQLVNDFENGLGSTTWSNSEGFGSGVAETVNDPAPAASVNNQVLRLTAGENADSTVRAITPMPAIADGQIGTVFLRFATDASASPVDGAFTVSPLEEPASFGDSNVLLSTTSAGAIAYYNPTDGYVPVLENREDLTWYKAWMIIDNQNDTSTLYLQGGEFAEPTEVATDFAFRGDTASDDLINLSFLMYAGSSGAGTSFAGVNYVDDIYVDPTTANLSDPYALTAYSKPFYGIHHRHELDDGALITIDGEMDDAYTERGAAIEYIKPSLTVTGPDDLSATYHGAWTHEGLYLYVDVTDDVFSVDSVDDEGNPVTYQDDSMEFYFDPIDNDNVNVDTNDLKLSIAPNADGSLTAVTGPGWPSDPPGADLSALAGATVLTDTGWVAEVFVPWAALQIDPEMNWNIGFGILINDDDGNDLSTEPDGSGDREGMLLWGSGGVEFNFHWDAAGDLRLWGVQETDIAGTSSAPAIDGTRDSAYEASAFNQTDGRWIASGGRPEDTSVLWAAVYDAENLYLHFDITDSVISSDADAEGSGWKDDSLELFLDGDNSKSGQLDGVNDIKFTFYPRLDGSLTVSHSGGTTDRPDVDIADVEAVHMLTDTGWTLEVRVPLSIIDLDPVPGTAFGIDFALNDDDNGGDREGQLTWSAGVGLNQRSDAMGTAYLWAPLHTTAAVTETAVTIDGGIDEAYMDSEWNALFRPNDGSVLPTENNMSGYWSALYDDSNIYIIVDLIDNSVSVDSESGYQDDSIEFFFDPGNDGAGGFDGVEDVKITVGVVPGGEATVTPGGYPPLPAGVDASGVEAAWSETAFGWRVELKVPFVTLSIDAPMAGMDLGFDIGINDDDFGGDRDNVVQWSALKSLNSGTDHFGTLYLAGDALFSTIIGASLVEDTFYESAWFGRFHENPSFGDWIHHEGLNWLYSGYIVPGTSGMWLYGDTLGAWVYTTPMVFPNIYIDGSGWAYYAYFGEGIAYLYNYPDSSWVEVQ